MNHKILNAIQEGIKQSFMLDDEIEDENFVKSKVATGMDVIKMQEHFDSLCYEGSFEDAYEYKNKYSVINKCVIDTSEQLYKVEELIKYGKASLNLLCDLLEFFDFSNIVNVIDNKGNVISLDKASSSYDKDELSLLEVNIDSHIMYISLAYKHKISPKFLKWCRQNINNCLVQINNAPIDPEKDFNGYENSLKIHAFAESHDINDCAVGYCLEQIYNFRNGKYQGYLPSSGELLLLSNHKEFLNYIFKNYIISNSLWTPVKNKQWELSDRNYWSSSEINDKFAYELHKDNNIIVKGSKSGYKSVLPLFKPVRKLNENQSFLLDDQVEDEKYVKSKVSDGVDLNKIQKGFNDLCLSCKLQEASKLFKTWNCLERFKIDDIIKLDAFQDMLLGTTQKHVILGNPQKYIAQYINLFDFSEYFTFIDNMNREVTLNEVEDITSLVFLKIKIPGDSGELHEMLISIFYDHHVPYHGLTWQSNSSYEFRNLSNEFDGFKNCKNISNVLNDNKALSAPAIDQCLKIKEYINGQTYQGYLPALAELKLIYKYVSMIDFILCNICKMTSLSHVFQNNVWTSTEYSCNYAYSLFNGKLEPEYKTHTGMIIPLFKPIDSINENQSFLLDDQVEDEKYVKSKVSNGVDVIKMQSDFNDLCMHGKFEKAYEIKNTWSFIEKVKIENVQDLGAISAYLYKETYNNKPYTNFDFVKDLFDISKFVVLATNDGHELTIDQIDKSNMKSVVFIKITLPIGDNGETHEMLIKARGDHGYDATTVKWQSEDYEHIYNQKYDTTYEAYDDLGGFENSMNVYKNHTKNEQGMSIAFQALRQCVAQVFNNGSYIYQGYLPAAKELSLLMPHAFLINYIFTSILSANYLCICFANLWTSTEISNNVYQENVIKMQQGKLVRTKKNDFVNTLTLFKKLKA